MFTRKQSVMKAQDTEMCLLHTLRVTRAIAKVTAMGTHSRTLCAITLALGAGCSTSFSSKNCAADEDCGAGLVCEFREREPVCVKVEEAPLVVGQSAPVSGTNQ